MRGVACGLAQWRPRDLDDLESPGLIGSRPTVEFPVAPAEAGEPLGRWPHPGGASPASLARPHIARLELPKDACRPRLLVPASREQPRGRKGTVPTKLGKTFRHMTQRQGNQPLNSQSQSILDALRTVHTTGSHGAQLCGVHR